MKRFKLLADDKVKRRRFDSFPGLRMTLKNWYRWGFSTSALRVSPRLCVGELLAGRLIRDQLGVWANFATVVVRAQKTPV